MTAILKKKPENNMAPDFPGKGFLVFNEQPTQTHMHKYAFSRFESTLTKKKIT